jgi:radical SAM superfamily enzyme YgiQ (UPF0313 family)
VTIGRPPRTPERIAPAAPRTQTERRLRDARRVLLIDVNNQRRWIGGHVDSPEVHIPPVALMLLATVLRLARPGVEVVLRESSLDAPTDSALRAMLDEIRPDVIGLRSISFFFEEFAHVARLLREWDPDVPVIVGGPVVESLRGRVLERCADVDVAVAGEGEFVLPELLDSLGLAGVRGLIWRDDDGTIVENAPRRLLEDLDALPFADYSLVDLGRYEQQLSYAYNHRRQGVLYTSRGCIFACSFCFQPSGLGARYRSAGNVFREIRELHDRHGVRDFYVIDDIFNVKRRRAMDVFRAVIDAGLDVRFYFVNGLRADLMDEEHIDLMVEAGTVWVTYAIETGNAEIRKLIRKDMNMPRAEAAIRYTQRKGIAVNVNTMFGFPTETRAMADETLAWMATRLEKPSLLPYHFGLKGYEGCEIVEQAEEAGWDIPSFLAEANKAYNHIPAGTPTFPRRDMIEHMIDYHTRFGMGSAERLSDAVSTLRRCGYTDRDVTDMYSILLNRSVSGVDDVVPSAMRSTDAMSR